MSSRNKTAKNRQKTDTVTSLVGSNKIDNAKPVETSINSSNMMIPNTTTIDLSEKSGNFISDVTLSAFMRDIPIDFTAYNLRPNRKVYPFFDNKDISNFIEKPNKIVLDTRSSYQSMITGAIRDVHYTGNAVSQSIDTSREEIFVYGQKASVLFSEVDETGNTILYISHLQPRTYFSQAAYNPPFTANFTSTVVSYVSPTVGAGVVSQIPLTQADLTLNNNIVVGAKSGQTANIVSYEHHSGFARIVTTADLHKLFADPSSNGSFIPPAEIDSSRLVSGIIDSARIRLSPDASTVDNWYNGNTISFVNGYVPGAVANIVSYNGATQIAEISIPTTDGLKTFLGLTPSSNIIYSIGDYKSPFNLLNPKLSHYTTKKGFLAGTFHVPDPKNSKTRFRVGDRILSITDVPTNLSDDSTTIAEYRFSSAGLEVVSRQIVSNTKTVTVATPTLPLIENAPVVVPPPVTTDTRTARERDRKDPIAQSFYVSPKEYPQGMFIPYIDIFFESKGTLPLTMQIRPLTNGVPDSNIVLPNATSLVQSEDVRLSSFPNANDANTYTRFTFPSPVYVAPDNDYAFLILTNDFDYSIYVSELGKKIIGTDRIVSEQPYLGSMFKSQNATTYTPIQSEDIMFVIHKCNFFGSGSIVMSEKKDITIGRPYFDQNYESNVSIDAFEVHSDSVELPGTELTFSYKALSERTNTLNPEYTIFKPDMRTLLPERAKVYGKYIFEDSFLMKAELRTTSADVSPVVSIKKQNLGTLTSVINNMGIDSYRISITDRGNNQTLQNTRVYFSGNVSGEAAEALPIIMIEREKTGKIAGLDFKNNGFNYFDDVRATVVSTDANSTPAIITVDSETGKSGGPAAARYISKTVTLAPEFDAGDLRVYLTAVKPPESNIQVYYKVHNSDDFDPISEKYWVKMEQKVGEINFSSRLNPIELEFRPSLSSNNIIYSTDSATFDSFNQFKIKIVMSSSDTVLTKIPYVYDMRAIALPADTR
jgi:hypothetical protein